jgi:serine/threonine protein kinase
MESCFLRLPFISLLTLHSTVSFFISEIHLGRLLGVGEFGAVYEVTRVTDDSRMQLKEIMLQARTSRNMEESFGFSHDDGYSPEEDQTVTETETEGGDMSSALEEVGEKKGTIRERCWKQGKARYAVKQVRKGSGKRKLLHAAVDLAAEREFLASMSHPNIIRLRGTIGTPGHPEFMLLMDRLHVSMEQKLQQWKHNVRGTMGCLGMRVRHKKASISLLSERVVAAYDVARALNFLHGHK